MRVYAQIFLSAHSGQGKNMIHIWSKQTQTPLSWSLESQWGIPRWNLIKSLLYPPSSAILAEESTQSCVQVHGNTLGTRDWASQQGLSSVRELVVMGIISGGCTVTKILLCNNTEMGSYALFGANSSSSYGVFKHWSGSAGGFVIQGLSSRQTTNPLCLS